MFNIPRKEINWGGRKLILEAGRVARQADGAVLASYGETVVLCTAVGQKQPKPGVDFFPLTVNYQEKTFAAGKIPGGFFKREGRPTEKEVLTSRLIDRPIRPLFAAGYRNETQVVCTVLSHDLENDPDVVAMIGASAALTISGIPFLGPIGAARVGYVDGQYVLNPLQEKLPESALDLVVAGTAEGVLMVESEAKELSEEVMLGAVTYGFEQFQAVIRAIVDLAEQCAKEPWDLPAAAPEAEAVATRMAELIGGDLRQAYAETAKQARTEKLALAKAKGSETLTAEGLPAELVSKKFKQLEQDIVRGAILETGRRIDGRDTKTVRPIDCQVGVLPRAHGSALFTRGETQALVVATLGTGEDEQIIDALEGEYRQAFMLHYNFPPYATTEAGRMGSPGRREIGHGKLAWRAVHPLLPTPEEFPYTLRLVAEIMESNGSSSMATVCGGSLALMDAGVPLKSLVAGVAMGLVKEGEKVGILTDINGAEDHYGDMDFKVAGTEKGVTALQMDIKIAGVSIEIMRAALQQAREARLIVLGKMREAIEKPRAELSPYAPRFVTIKIRPEKIREIIGPGGKVIRGIQEQTGTKIDVEDDGRVTVFSPDNASVQKALGIIQDICREVELDRIYLGKVKKIVEFGAFVEVIPNTEGLLHISQIAESRIRTVQDVLTEGDEVLVKVIEIDGNGKMRLSRKMALRDQPALADKEKLKNPMAANPPRA